MRSASRWIRPCTVTTRSRSCSTDSAQGLWAGTAARARPAALEQGSPRRSSGERDPDLNRRPEQQEVGKQQAGPPTLPPARSEEMVCPPRHLCPWPPSAGHPDVTPCPVPGATGDQQHDPGLCAPHCRSQSQGPPGWAPYPPRAQHTLPSPKEPPHTACRPSCQSRLQHRRPGPWARGHAPPPQHRLWPWLTSVNTR